MHGKGLKQPTPTRSELDLKIADFSSLARALDYAAGGRTGYNFYRGGELRSVLSYADLRADARRLASRLCGLGVPRGGRVALVADTDPDFLRFFFACQYAGLIPVPLPALVQMGGRDAYVNQLRRLLGICGAEIAVSPKGFHPFLTEAAEGLNLRFTGTPAMFADLPEADTELRPLDGEEPAYLQYTSGSTRFPRGAVISQRAVMSNLADIGVHGIGVRRSDRCVSWLPFYHDMGLVGLVLVPVATQMSVDYLSTFDFVMRPRQWLALITQNRATLSIGPPFGYELCARRVREENIAGYDFSRWRFAGVGAEMIRAEQLREFARIFAPCGFRQEAFVACYGMAECSLAVSFAPLGRGLEVDCVDGERLASRKEAVPLHDHDPGGGRGKTFVKCGIPLPRYEVEVRDPEGRVLPERRCGTLFVRGPSVMSGYFGDPETTREVLSPDGWLNTGDVAYRASGAIVVTGREKDLIIIKGRNIWPQDLEYLADLQPEVRSGDAAAFSIPDPDGGERAVMMIECRQSDPVKRARLVERLKSVVFEEIGIECMIYLVPRNVLPRTTSGKLSRSEARRRFLERVGEEELTDSGIDLYERAMCA